jgi:transcriptional regulator GlxA family with amidase domain
MRGSLPSVTRYSKIVSHLNELIAERPMAPLYTIDLACRMGISTRTLQAAVKVVIGVSLHRYVRLVRLLSVRYQLQNGCRSVKAAALGNGFWHLGEFSRVYKNTFGEKPSQTLAGARRAQYTLMAPAPSEPIGSVGVQSNANAEAPHIDAA